MDSGRLFEFTIKISREMHGIKTVEQAVIRMSDEVKRDLLALDDKLLTIKIKEIK